MATIVHNHRDRFVRVGHKTHSTRRGSSIYDPDYGMAWTAEFLIEEEYDYSPIPTGLLDEHGDEIVRIPWRDTVPLGFLDREDPDEEDEGY